MRLFLGFLQIIEKNGSHEYGYVLIKKTPQKFTLFERNTVL